MIQGIRQLEEKNVGNEITHMIWSSRMDLVAFSNIKGEVALHRLSWTRAWVLNPPIEGLTVTNLAWRPDGKVLAIAYSDGKVVLVNIETKCIVNKFVIEAELCFMSWVQEKSEVKVNTDNPLIDEDLDVGQFTDLSKPYINDPPPVSHMEGAVNFEDLKGLTSFLQDQTEFNMLVIGTICGLIEFRIFGCWNCLVLNVRDIVGYACSIRNVHLSEDFSQLFVTIAHQDNNADVIIMDSSIFRNHKVELHSVTIKYIKLYELSTYLWKILTSITETWEGMLMEFDKKLANYASQVPAGGVTADFMELLLFGMYSERLEEFLMRDLTKKGLEKFGHTMEVSYTNIQSYLLRHIIKFSQNGTFHLAELKGMACFEERFGILGLNVDEIQEATRSMGAFLIKASEMQQILNHSVLDYKVFFRWLYTSIMILMDEAVTPDMEKMTQQDIECIMNFLPNFDNYGRNDDPDNKEPKFVMERLGQYLLDEKLSIKPDMSGNDWTRFLDRNHCLRDNPNVLQQHSDKSLVQVYNEMNEHVGNVFETPKSVIETAIKPASRFGCATLGVGPLLVSSVNLTSDVTLLALLNPPASLYLFETGGGGGGGGGGSLSVRGAKFFFHIDAAPSDIMDVQFYNANILSVLLRDTRGARKGIIVQMPVAQALDELRVMDVSGRFRDEDFRTVNGWSFGQKYYKYVEMSAVQFSVSGTRKVSIVLAENRRKVKLYEMECEEDEDDEVDMSTSCFMKD